MMIGLILIFAACLIGWMTFTGMWQRLFTGGTNAGG